MDRVSVDPEHIARTAHSLRETARAMSDSGHRFADGFQAGGYGHLLESDEAAAQTREVVQAVLDGVRGQVEELLRHADGLDQQAGEYRSTENTAEQATSRLRSALTELENRS